MGPPSGGDAIVVCPLVPHPPVSGGQKRTLRMLEAIERAGVRPHLLTTDDRSPEGVAALRARGWTVEVLPAPSPGLASRARQHLARHPSPPSRDVAARVAALAPRAAFVQLEHAQSGAYLRGDRCVVSLHNIDSAVLAQLAREQRPGTPAWLRARSRAAAMRTAERRAVPRAALVACVSQDDAREAERLGGRVLVAPNGVDDELFAVPDAPPDGETVLFFGALTYAPNRLGLERFVAEGWPRLLERRPGARLAVAGPGLEPPLAARLGATPGVQVLGLVADLAGVLAAARVVVVPLWHGGGTRLKVVEALAAARPVVGTPLGVHGTGFADGRHGLLGASPAQLADGVAALLGDPARAAQLGLAGRALAGDRRWSATLAPLERAYRGLAASSRR